MSRQLKNVVVVDGVVYGPGYEIEVPEYVARRITNPLAWGEDADSDEGHGIPGDHEQQAAGLLPHTPVQPNQVTPSEPAGPGGVNPLQPPDPGSASSAVPAAGPAPKGIITSNVGVDEGDAQDPAFGSQWLLESVTPGPVERSSEESVPSRSDSAEEQEQEPESRDEEPGPNEADEVESPRALLPEPPRAGSGATASAWAAFARDHGVTVRDGASRQVIIDACREAQVIK